MSQYAGRGRVFLFFIQIKNRHKVTVVLTREDHRRCHHQQRNVFVCCLGRHFYIVQSTFEPSSLTSLLLNSETQKLVCRIQSVSFVSPQNRSCHPCKTATKVSACSCCTQIVSAEELSLAAPSPQDSCQTLVGRSAHRHTAAFTVA